MAHAHSPGYVRLVEDLRERVKHFSIDEFLVRLQAGERYILLDVREESEWARGHLPSAYHLSKGIIEREIEQAIPEQATPIVLYCGGGFRSVLTADNLQRMGYTKVLSMDGGYRGWIEAGGELEEPA